MSLGSLVILWAYPDLRFTLLGRELLQQIGVELTTSVGLFPSL